VLQEIITGGKKKARNGALAHLSAISVTRSNSLRKESPPEIRRLNLNQRWVSAFQVMTLLCSCSCRIIRLSILYCSWFN